MMDKDDNSWHLDRRVPIALIVTIMAQTFGFGWWAASLSERVTALESSAPLTREELGKLETSREQTNLAMQSLNDKVDEILAFIKAPTSPLHR